MVAIKGATALVTGGQRGLGKALTTALLARGATKVYVTARQPIESHDPQIVALPLDVTDPDSVATLASAAGDVDIVFNNAGIVIPGPLLAADIADVAAVFDTNVFGTLRVAQAFAPILSAHAGGAMVNIHSVLSWASGAGAYGASKAALWSLTNSLRIEMASTETQVLGVHVSYIDTDMTAGVVAAKNRPEHVADIVLSALENGDIEVLVDDDSKRLKAALIGPPDGLRIM